MVELRTPNTYLDPYIHTPKIALQIFPNVIYLLPCLGDHYSHQNVMEICICLFVLTSTMKIIFHKLDCHIGNII